MKFQSFALLSAGLLTAAVLSACQRTGDKTTVADGRDPRGQSKPQSDLTKIGGFQCLGDVSIGADTFKVNKKIAWNGQTAGQENLLEKIDQKDGNPLIAFQVKPRSNIDAARMAISVRNLEKNKDFVAVSTVQNEVQLTFKHQGAVETKVNILCEPLNPLLPDAPFVLKDEKTEVLCQGAIGKKDEATELHDPAVLSIQVAAKDNKQIAIDKLSLGTTLLNVKLVSDSSLTSEKTGKSAIKLTSEDGKLELSAQSRLDIALSIQVIEKSQTSDDENLQLFYGCNRADILGKATVTNLDPTTQGDARDVDATTTTSTTSTTVPVVGPVIKQEITID